MMSNSSSFSFGFIFLKKNKLVGPPSMMVFDLLLNLYDGFQLFTEPQQEVCHVWFHGVSYGLI